MAEEKIWRDVILGPLHLGTQYPEVGPGLGRLYDVRQLADAFVLVTTALQSVEDTPQVQAHLASGVTEAQKVRRMQVHRAWRGLGGRALAGAAVLVVGLGLWLDSTRVEESSPFTLDEPDPRRASTVVQLNLLGPVPPAYPLPKIPFENQATAPLCTKKGVVEINGGCWVELAQKPPCNDDEAEHQGKCYLPVSKPEKKRPPQSVQP